MRLELEDCSSVEEYVDEILTTSQKLQEIGFPQMDVADPHDGAAETIRADDHRNGRIRYQLAGRLDEVEDAAGRDDRIQHKDWRSKWSVSRRTSRS